MVGLVLDGGIVLRARSSSFDLAGGAARAGAQELDQAALAEGRIALDPESARLAALDWLGARGAEGSAVVEADSVTVTVHRRVDLQMLAVGAVTVSETSTAQAQRGRADT